MALPNSTNANCVQIAEQICATMATIVQEIMQEARHTPTDNRLKNHAHPKSDRRVFICGYTQDEDCLCVATDDIWFCDDVVFASEDEGNSKADKQRVQSFIDSNQGSVTNDAQQAFDKSPEQEGDRVISEVGDHKNLLAKMDDPNSPNHQVGDQLGHKRIDSLPKNKFSTPLTRTTLLVRDSLQIERGRNIANKVFDILPERDGYNPALNPKPPDEDPGTQFSKLVQTALITNYEVHSTTTLLDKNNLVKYDKKNGYFQVIDLGLIASYYYISHGTITTYNEHLKPTMDDIELCRMFSLNEKFKNVTVRMELAKLLDRVSISIKESLEESSAKINVLLQAYISQLKLEGLFLMSDMVFIPHSVGRLMQVLFEIVLKKRWAQLTEKALNWCKMVNKRMWNVQSPLRQFNGIPNEILLKLEKKDLAWELRNYDLSSQELGEFIQFFKMGRTLHKLVHQFPQLILAAHVQPVTRTVLMIELTITPDFQWEDKVHGYVKPFWVIVEGLGMRVDVITGETTMDQKLLKKDQVIISTSDKWDVLSRRWKQQKHVQQVSLFIVDELHLIGRQGGPILEVIVSRMRSIASQGENKICIVALSISLANAKNLGKWIWATSHGLFNFPQGVRPVSLEIIHIQGLDIANFEARTQAMTKPTYTAIVQHAKNGKLVIVSISTRKHARLTVVDLMTYSSVERGENSILCYTAGLEIQNQLISKKDPRIGETCSAIQDVYKLKSSDAFSSNESRPMEKAQLILLGALDEQAIDRVSKIKDGHSPATWMLDVTSEGHEAAGVNFAEVYKNSELYRRNKALIKEVSKPAPGSKDLYFPTQYSQSFFTQCMACLWKQHWSYWRNPPYNAVRFLFTIFIALLFGTIFWNVGSMRRRKQDLFNSMGSMYAAVLFLGVQNATTVQPVVAIERTVFYRERAAGMYSALPYAVGQVLIELPYSFVQTILYGIIVYAMLGFEWTVAKFLWYLFFIYFTLLYFTFYGMMTVAVTPNHNIAAIVSSAFYGLWNLFSGFIVPKTRIPVWWRWYYYICPVSWTLYGLVASQFGDLQDKLETGETVEHFVRSYFGFEYDFVGYVAAIIFGLAALFGFIFAYSIKAFNFQNR